MTWLGVAHGRGDVGNRNAGVLQHWQGPLHSHLVDPSIFSRQNQVVSPRASIQKAMVTPIAAGEAQAAGEQRSAYSHRVASFPYPS